MVKNQKKNKPLKKWKGSMNQIVNVVVAITHNA